jgi:hypothetical protein
MVSRSILPQARKNKPGAFLKVNVLIIRDGVTRGTGTTTKPGVAKFAMNTNGGKLDANNNEAVLNALFGTAIVLTYLITTGHRKWNENLFE